jgi:exopolysaccharide biosynthesis polyprenyl glycosylphosphotransferase
MGRWAADRHDTELGSLGVEALDLTDPVRSEANSATMNETTIRLGPVVHDAFEPRLVYRPRARRRYRVIAYGLVLTDAACILIALITAYFARFQTLRTPYALAMVAAPVLWAGVFRAFDLYSTHRLSPEEEFRRVLGASSMGVMLIVLGTYWAHSPPSRLWMGLTLVLALTLELVARRGWRWTTWRLKRSGWLSFRTLLIANRFDIDPVFEALSRPGAGFRLVGCVSPGGLQAMPADESDLPLLGDLDELDSIMVDQGADCLFVARTSLDSDDMLKVVQAARRHGAELRLLANLPEVLASRVNIQQIGQVTALALRSATLTKSQLAMKRLSDVIMSGIALLVLSPVLAAVALLVRLTSPGPVLFRQTRVTTGGRSFTMNKFRTMVADADDIMARQTIDKTVPFFKLSADSLMTPIGAFLRRTSLDELPQLFNVLKGEMSLVGPRPLPEEQVAANLEILGPRHEVRAGMTGWWQINGRGIADVEQAVRMDRFYIENWSLSLDIYILLKTLGAVVLGRGAY